MNWLPWPDLELPHLPTFNPVIPQIIDMPGDPAQWAVLFPMLVAAVAFMLPNRLPRAVGWVVIGGGVASVLIAIWQLVRLGGSNAMQRSATIGGLPLGEVDVPLQLSINTLIATVALIVALVALIVQAFGRWYLWYDPRYRQFAATVALFTAAMMLVVHSGDVILTLIGWEVMGWCSYLLIGHHSVKAAATRAASKALIVTRVADIGFVLGIVALAAGAGTTSIAGIIEHWQPRPSAALTVALLLLITGVAGKSALFPFQDWLPDAMEGPTPASALIHAATMVAAGTVVLAQLLPLLHASDTARLTLAVAASVSTIGAALMAFAQPDLKRLLAWSTVSQVALMLAALSAIPVGEDPDAALLHLMSHATFKALLFLSLGWLAVLTGGTLAAYVVSGTQRFGSLRRPLGWGLLALAGVPPFIGFFSKELILSAAEAGAQSPSSLPGLIVLAAVGAGAPLTAAYCLRAWLILDRPDPAPGALAAGSAGKEIDDFFTDPHVMAEAVGVEAAEAAISSTARAGITTLTLLVLLGGILPFTVLVDVELLFNLPLMLASLALMTAAALAVWAASRGVRTRDAAARLPNSLRQRLERGLDADTAYQVVVARPTLRLARAITWIDATILDGYVRAFGHGSALLGQAGQKFNPVRPAPSLVLVLAGLAIFVVIAVVRQWVSP
ncbi:MAG: proton-conducting transporter membrane subunit [Ornithinimicrobium sp.]